MMAAYVALFVFWRLVPLRVAFVAGALLVAAGLLTAMFVAIRRSYFAGRLDVVLHALVIVDVVLEGVAFEILLPFVRTEGMVPTLAARYHDNSGFFLCALLFATVIGVGHYMGLRRRRAGVSREGLRESAECQRP
jgi:hypothetical protein